MRERIGHQALRYGVAVVCAGSTLLLKLVLAQFINLNDLPFALVFGAIMVSAWYGGIGPGLLATALLVLATDWFFLTPGTLVFQEPVAAAARLALLAAEGVLVTLLGGLLHRSESRGAAITRNAIDGIITIDARGRVVAFNPAAEQIFGLAAPLVVGRPLAELIIPERLREQHRQGLERYLATGESRILGRRIELPALRSDGTEFTIELSITRHASSGPPLFTGSVRDVTRRKQGEQAYARLAAVIDSSSDAIIGRTPDGLICDWNLAAARLYGYTAEEAVGRAPASFLLPPGQVQEEAELLQAMRAGRRVVQFETTRRHKHGRELAISLTLSPVRDERGILLGWSSIERDITRRKTAERQQAAALTAAIEANRAKNEFLANVSHEVRTPLNAVIGMLDLALADELSPTLRDYLSTAHESAKTLLDLLNDLLDFSRMEAGRFEMELAPFSLPDTLAAAVRALSVRAQEKHVELMLRISPDVPTRLLGDGRRLRQIILNLVGNAIKFTEHGQVVVQAQVADPLAPRSQCAPQEGDPDDDADPPGDLLLQFSVCDTGMGIAPEDQERIFEPFTQVDATSTRRHAGTGLGLAICRELSTRMGGRLWVESQLGRGSEFHFTALFSALPATETPPDALGDAIRAWPVLVVDDNSFSRQILCETLTHWGAVPASARDAESALALAQAAERSGCPFRLAVVDHLMPEVDGPMLIARLRREAQYQGPIVFMSAAAVPQCVAADLALLGVTGFMEKPVSSVHLSSALLWAIGANHDGDAQPAAPEPAPSPLRILLAEDMRANQKIVTTLLARRGHSVETAQNGREAVALAARGAFDVILMDVQMPVLDGFQAVEAIRRLPDPARATVPVIAMTAHAMQGDRERCLTAGMNDYLSKPIDAAQLVAAVERITRRAADEFQALEPLAPPAANMPAVINQAAALRRLGGNTELFREVAQYFDESAPGLLAQIQAGLARGDHDSVLRAAHALKGLAGNLQADAVEEAAARFAAAIPPAAQNAVSGDELLRDLRQEVSALSAALSVLCAEN